MISKLTTEHEAMPGDDMNEGSISSLLLNAHNPNQIADALSAADESWINSILVNESYIEDTDWSSMQKALLNILRPEADSVNTSATKPNDISTSDDSVFMHQEAENNENNTSEKKSDFSLQSNNYSSENVFKPGCKDAMLENLNIDYGLDLELSEYDADVSADDIFKVWDLEILEEKDEDELTQQLTSALAKTKSSFKMSPSTFDDSTTLIELKDDDLDELIAGITDLSLTPKSN